MNNLAKYEQVIQEHVCLYVYSIMLDQLHVFNDVRLIKNTMTPNSPRYYIHHYSGNDTTEYTVLPDAGKVLYSGCGGTFKVWLTEADDSMGVKSLLDAVDIYTTGKIKKASDTITEMQKKRDIAHETLEFMM